MTGDIFEDGTPKYSTATDIYEAVQRLATGEEIGILQEMYSDVSWEGQEYYYTDNGGRLEERWGEATDGGDRMWLMDVAVWQLSGNDANEMFFDILSNEDLQKRIGFKKLFTDLILPDKRMRYDEVTEAFLTYLGEQMFFDFCGNSQALKAAIEDTIGTTVINYYPDLCSKVYEKLRGLKLEDERQLIIESRGLLTSYDDFMYGLKSNQYLYQQQERMYKNKVAALQESYKKAVMTVLAAAQKQGVVLNSETIAAVGKIEMLNLTEGKNNDG